MAQTKDTRQDTSVRQTAQQMVAFFQSYDTQRGVPSFEKFAGTLGLDGEVLAAQAATSPTLSRAMRRCRSILRDMLTDGGLLKRYDPSFCKYILDSMKEADQLGGGDEAAFEVRIEIEQGES